eukprot:6021817-Pleurochrysis_carterae.AAC.1
MANAAGTDMKKLCPGLRRQRFRGRLRTQTQRSGEPGSRALNEYATCYISCYTRNPCNAKWPHVGVLRALGQ